MCVLVCFENYIYVFRCTCIYNMFSFLFIHAKIDIGMYFGSYKKSFVQYIYTFETNPKVGIIHKFYFQHVWCSGRQRLGGTHIYYLFIYLFIYLLVFLHLCKTKCILFFVPSFLQTICILGELHLFTYIFKHIHNIHIYVFHLCFTICILGEMYIQIFIYDKTPKVHRGGGGPPL